jgi:hypothetical protein
MHCSHPPPSAIIAIPFAKKLPIWATSLHDAHQDQCHDVARIGFTVAPWVYFQ